MGIGWRTKSTTTVPHKGSAILRVYQNDYKPMAIYRATISTIDKDVIVKQPCPGDKVFSNHDGTLNVVKERTLDPQPSKKNHTRATIIQH